MNCYLVGAGNRDLNNPLNWSSISGGAGADLLGSEKITNGDFSVDSNWNKQTGWSISGGVAVSNNGTGFIFQNSGITPLKLYKITYTVVTITNGFVRILFNGGSNKYGAIRNSVGLYTEYIQAHSLANGNISFESTYFIGTVDNLSVKEVLCFPNSSNPAIIDANSSIANGDVLSLSAQFDCGGFDCSAAAYTFTLSNAAYAFNVYGDLKDSTKRVNGFSSTGYLYFKGSSNIYSNGATRGWNRIIMDGVGATFTNQDDWNVGNTPFYLTNGGWDINSRTVTSTGAFNTATGTKSLTLSTGIFNIQAWQNTTATNFTFNKGTGTVVINTSITSTFTGTNTFYNLTLNGGANIASSLSYANNITVDNTLTLTGNNAQNYRLLIASNTIGTPRTITCNGSIIASNVDFRDITLAGTANRDLSAITCGSGDCGGNSGITFTPSQTQYFKHTSGACQWSDATKWVTSSGGSIQGRVPLPQDDPIFDQNSFTGASTLSVNCPRIGRSLNMEAVNQAVTFSLANNVEFYGSFIYGEMLQNIISGELYAMGRGNFNLDFKGKSIFTFKTLTTNVSIYNFVNNVTIARYFNPNSGKLLLNNSIITLTANDITSFAWSGGILEAGNSIIKISPISGSAVVEFKGSGLSLNKVIFSGSHTGNFIITGNNTFNELVIEKGRKVQITGGSTQTISPTGKLTADGTPTEQIQITSTNTTPYNLVYAGTGFHQVNYCNISYCNATADRFYAGKNSTDGGNNTGWKFRSYLAQNTQIL